MQEDVVLLPLPAKLREDGVRVYAPVALLAGLAVGDPLAFRIVRDNAGEEWGKLLEHLSACLADMVQKDAPFWTVITPDGVESVLRALRDALQERPFVVEDPFHILRKGVESAEDVAETLRVPVAGLCLFLCSEEGKQVVNEVLA